MEIKADIPSIYYSEGEKYIELAFKVNLSTNSGSWTSTSSSIVYTYTNETDLLNQLFNPLKGYLITAQNWNDVVNKLNTQSTQTDTLTNGVQSITTDQSSLVSAKANGVTLVNLLGKDGNCEDISKWNVVYVTTALDSANKVYGNNGIKATVNAGYTSGYFYKNIFSNISTGKYYLIVADVKNGNASTGVRVAFFNIGDTNATGNYVTNTSSFQISYKTMSPTDYDVATEIRASVQVVGSEGQYGYADGIRVFEISSTEKTYIDSLSVTDAQNYIAKKYPYIDSAQHLSPALRKWGKNLANIDINNLQNKVISTADGSETTELTYVSPVQHIPVIPNTTYIRSRNLSIYQLPPIFFYDSNKSYISYVAAGTTFTTPSNCYYIKYWIRRIDLGNIDLATFSQDSQLQIELGSTATTFEPYNEDYLYPYMPDGSLVKIASNIDRSVYDILDYDKKEVLRKFKQIKLDGSLSWIWNADATGFKRVGIAVSNLSNILTSGEIITTKSDGKILPKVALANIVSDTTYLDTSNYVIAISDSDSGWGETYTPLTAEQQAYFYGYKMNNGTFGTNYNGTGTKTWIPWGATDNTNAVTTVPTIVSTAITSGTYDYYRLTYQLASPVTEPIEVEGSISLHDGLNQVQLLEGIVVREKVTPYLSGTTYYINASNSSSWLKNRTDVILQVYKGNEEDNNWQIKSNGTENGKGYATLPQSLFDPTASYYVTYIVLDKYKLTSNAIDTSVTYAKNLKTSIDELNQGMADVKEHDSVQDWLIMLNEAYSENIRQDLDDANYLLDKVKTVDGYSSGLIVSDSEKWQGKLLNELALIDTEGILHQNTTQVGHNNLSYIIVNSFIYPNSISKRRITISQIDWNLWTQNSTYAAYGKTSIQINSQSEIFYPERSTTSTTAVAYTDNMSVDSLLTFTGTALTVRLYLKSASTGTTYAYSNLFKITGKTYIMV